MPKRLDLTGQKFGRLNVIGFHEKVKDKNWWLCKCECGNINVVATASLRSGHTRSCGCIHKEFLLGMITRHGESRSPEYRAWKGMKKRCTNQNDDSYSNYGGRGITVCERWVDSFDNFLEDMGKRPTAKHSLDRKDNEKGYSKENCRWATHKQQGNNKRNVAKNILNGVRVNRKELCMYLGIGPSSMYRFFRQGMSIEDIKNRFDLKKELGINKNGRLPQDTL